MLTRVEVGRRTEIYKNKSHTQSKVRNTMSLRSLVENSKAYQKTSFTILLMDELTPDPYLKDEI